MLNDTASLAKEGVYSLLLVVARIESDNRLVYSRWNFWIDAFVNDSDSETTCLLKIGDSGTVESCREPTVPLITVSEEECSVAVPPLVYVSVVLLTTLNAISYGLLECEKL